MTVEEFDFALTELETRVDRLRALYENWFRGYEKSEPMVPRKDVERRVYALRKELPRNTALRFRYHQLYLRYTTMANHWQRTARQIEEGTYKPQLQRLKRKTEQERRELERRERRKHDRGEEEQEGPRGYELDLDESLNVDDLLDELELDEVAKALEEPGPHSEAPPPTKQHPKLAPLPASPAVGTFAKISKDPNAPSGARPVAQVGGKTAPGVPSAPQLGAPNVQLPAPGRSLPAVPGRPIPTEPGTGTLTGLRPGLPAAAPGPAGAAAQAGSRLGPPPAPAAGTRPALPGPALGPGTGSHAGLRPGAPATTASPAGAFGTGTHAGLPRPSLPGAPVPAPAVSRPVGGAAVPPQRPPIGAPTAPAPAAPPPVATRAAPPPAAAGAVPPPAAAGAARPAAAPPPAAAGAARSPAAAPAAPPPAAAPAVRPPRPAPPVPTATTLGRPPPVAPPAPRAPVPASAGGGTFVGRPPVASPIANTGAPDEQRLKRIYDEYAAARKRNHEGEVRYEAMVSSIQKMLPELSKKHLGKRIDFEIVVKDGRVGLKPKAT